MNYFLKVLNSDTNQEEVIQGTDANDVLTRASRYILKQKMGNYFYSLPKEKRLTREIKKDLAIQFTNGLIEKNKKWENIKLLSEIPGFNIFKYTNDKINIPFSQPKPKFLTYPSEPIYDEIPSAPDINSPDYFIEKKFSHKIFPKKYKRLLDDVKKQYQKDYDIWDTKRNEIEKHNLELKETYQANKKEIDNKNDSAILSWQNQKDYYEKQIEKKVTKNQKYEIDYKKGKSTTIEKYNRDILAEFIELLEFKDQEIFTFYNSKSQILAVEFQLPNTEEISAVKDIKYVIARDTFEEKEMSKTEFSNYYDDIIYKMTLNSINELFKLDFNNYLKSIVFNGFVKTIDKSTGQNIQPFILSLFVSKEDLLNINLKHVEYKSCFKSLKGVCASSLHTQTPIAPVIQINKKDKRFVDQKNVLNEMSNQTNLASMDWEDFEHLVREVFEKEFSQNGGEVKVTQASRDGGVDAIAFDPDPIRGGKIIIQAKRYTNTVGVNAVRDLYGTVMNEGATKGILVTTSDYGSDAYNFASGKPLSLLNGSNLLYLLEKHGHIFKIDIDEAKKKFNENK